MRENVFRLYLIWDLYLEHIKNSYNSVRKANNPRMIHRWPIIHAKMLSIISRQGNANPNHNAMNTRFRP